MSISFDEEFETWGEAEVRRQLLLPENANSIMLMRAPAWLASKAFLREDATLSIAKEANRLASEANSIARRAERWAMYAAIAAIIAIALTVIFNK